MLTISVFYVVRAVIGFIAEPRFASRLGRADRPGAEDGPQRLTCRRGPGTVRARTGVCAAQIMVGVVPMVTAVVMVATAAVQIRVDGGLKNSLAYLRKAP